MPPGLSVRSRMHHEPYIYVPMAFQTPIAKYYSFLNFHWDLLREAFVSEDSQPKSITHSTDHLISSQSRTLASVGVRPGGRGPFVSAKGLKIRDAQARLI
ncbi:MAG: hypothetical protein NPIRA01_25740 [Nitrospirales bacterium]|nr:MAG: hypothetical protein NPIRA01_25740 [Nitrospirales bacterium]